MSAARFLPVIIGVVLVVIGLLGVTSVLPELSVTCGSDCVGEYVVADFTISASGLTATLVDNSGVIVNGHEIVGDISGIALQWGDGSSVANTLRGTQHHTYASSGTYTVEEEVQGNFTNDPPDYINSATFSASLTVAVSTNGTVKPTYRLSPTFGVSVADTNVTLSDETVVVNVTDVSLVVTWGDGTSTTLPAPGSVVVHDYSLPKGDNPNATVEYAITETGSGINPEGEPFSVGGITTTVDITFGCVAAGDCSPPPPPPPCQDTGTCSTTNNSAIIAHPVNFVTVGLIALGGSVAVIPYAIRRPDIAVVLIAAIAAVGGIVGYFIGGVGPL